MIKGYMMNRSKKDMLDPINNHIGTRIRMRRNVLKISQEKLAEKVGISPQQVQKYESGNSRINTSRLYQIKKAFDVDISYFFEGFSDHDDIKTSSEDSCVAGTVEESCMLHAYRQLTKEKQQAILNLLEAWSQD